MASILEKYKKDNSLLEKYQSKRQEPTILDNKGVSNQANPISTYNQKQQYENILPDITNEEGQIIDEDADVFTKIIKTVASAGADVLYGASKGVEGIIDAGGILISKLDKGDTITDFVEKDWTKELLGDVKTSAHKDSFYSEDSIVSDVLVNVGQMLPSIALNVATGGTAGTVAFGLSAGGSGAEQALQEGATKDEAILYGTINGAVETAIEMLSGGLGGLGKGQITKLMPNLSMKMAKSTATKVLVNMAGEGVEEMVSESLQPLMKSIYKDDALEEYKSDEFVGNVLQAGLNGALCSAVIMGGNVALTSKGSRVASNVVELQDEMIKQVEEGNLEQANELANEINSKTTEFSSEIEKELSKKGTTINEILEQNELSEVSRLQSEIRDKNLKESKKEKISSRLSNLESSISEKVKAMDVEERKKYINRTAQNYKYNKDGSFKKSYLNADAETKAKQDYASEMIRNLNKITSSNFGLNFTNRKSVNGYVKGNVITLSNSLNNEELWKQAYAKTTGHELTHTAEGKKLYELVFANYFESQNNNEEFKKEFDAKKNLYLNSNEKGLDAFKKMSVEKQDEYIKQEMFADVFGDMLSDKSLARKLVGDNRNTLEKLVDFFKERKENLDKFKGNKKLLKEYKKAINESFNIFTSLLKESESAKSDNNKKEKLSLKGEENEFRRLQEESREEFAKSSEQRIYAKNNERLQRRLSEIFKRRLDSRGYNSSSNRILHLKDFNLYENIDGDLFHDIFEIARNYTENGELVDLHDDYKDSICYLSDDGLSGFAITNDGDLISVFNCGRKRGFLSNISQIVKEKAKTLDCYASVNQDLQKMYNLIFDFKTASLMDYNMEYDHDNIAKNHNMPKVAFMVNTNKKVETKFFDKDSYDEAKEYQMSFFKTKYSIKKDSDKNTDYYEEIYGIKMLKESIIDEKSFKQAYKDLVKFDNDKVYENSFREFENFVIEKLNYNNINDAKIEEKIIEDYRKKSDKNLTSYQRNKDKGFRSPEFLSRNQNSYNNLKQLRESGKTVSFTEKRLSSFIDISSTKFNEDYATYFSYYISPQEFLELTVPTSYKEKFKNETRKLDLEELKTKPMRLGDSIYLVIDMQSGKIKGHEGRHRMYALMKEGYTQVQILIDPYYETYDKYNPEKTIPNTLKGQIFNNTKTTSLNVPVFKEQLIPINKKNEEKLLKFVESKKSNVRYSVKSPTLSKVKTVTTQINQNKINAFKKGTEQAKIALIDTMAGVNNIIKLYTENKDNYEVKANLLRGFKNRADYSLQNGIRNLKGDKVLSKSYDEIFNWMDTEQKRTEYYDYLLHNHNVDRMNLFKKVTANDIQKLNFLTDYKKAKMIKKISDSKQESLSIEEFKSFMTEKQFNEFKEVFREPKPVFGNDVTAKDSLEIISEYDKKYPEFKEHAKDVWQFADALNRLRLEAGLIDVNQYREMASIYPHYVPTEREIQSTLLSKPVAGSAKNVSTGVKKAKGSDILIKPLHEQFASQLKRVYKNIAVNEMAKDIYDAKMNSKYKDSNQDVRIVEQIKIRKTVDEYTEEDLGEKGNVVSFYKNGERISMEVTNEILEGFNTLSSVNDYSNNLILKPINKANKLFKAFTTEFNPFFIIRNFSRDIQDALLYSKNGIKSLSKNMPKAFKEILKNGEIWQRYCSMGGLYSSFFDFNNGIIVNKPLSKPNILNPKNALSKVKNKIARANMIVEQSVRIAEFISSLENGKSYEEAFYDAQEITVNFGRSGKATKALNATVMPFLNAQVQGFVKLYRTIFSRKTLKELASLLARAILIGLTPSLFNYIVYYDDDEYQGLSDYYRDNNYLIKIGDKFVKIPKGRVITVLSSALTKSADYLLKGDKTAFEGYGETVSQAVSPVNDFRTILSPINDVKTNTTWYGGQIESSKYDNIRPSDRYDESTSAISKALGKVFNYSPKKIDYLIDQYSGVIGDILIPATNSDGKTNALTFVSSNLTVDPVYKTKYYQDFSKKLTKLQYLKSDGDAVATLQVKYMNKVKSKISELYDEQRKIEEDTSLSKNEKDQQLKTIQLLINNMYKTAYENVDALGSNLNQLQLSEDSIDDDYYYGLYLTFGAETALKFHSTKLFEKASNLVGNSSLTYDDFFFTYFDCKGMKKSEAKAYIQSLPMSKSNKQKLFESLF